MIYDEIKISMAIVENRLDQLRKKGFKNLTPAQMKKYDELCDLWDYLKAKKENEK